MAPKRKAPHPTHRPRYCLTYEAGNAAGPAVAVPLGTVNSKAAAMRSAQVAMTTQCPWGAAWVKPRGFDLHKAVTRVADCPDAGHVIHVVDPLGLYSRVRIALVEGGGAPLHKRPVLRPAASVGRAAFAGAATGAVLVMDSGAGGDAGRAAGSTPSAASVTTRGAFVAVAAETATSTELIKAAARAVVNAAGEQAAKTASAKSASAAGAVQTVVAPEAAAKRASRRHHAAVATGRVKKETRRTAKQAASVGAANSEAAGAALHKSSGASLKQAAAARAKKNGGAPGGALAKKAAAGLGGKTCGAHAKKSFTAYSMKASAALAKKASAVPFKRAPAAPAKKALAAATKKAAAAPAKKATAAPKRSVAARVKRPAAASATSEDAVVVFGSSSTQSPATPTERVITLSVAPAIAGAPPPLRDVYVLSVEVGDPSTRLRTAVVGVVESRTAALAVAATAATAHSPWGAAWAAAPAAFAVHNVAREPSVVTDGAALVDLLTRDGCYFHARARRLRLDLAKAAPAATADATGAPTTVYVLTAEEGEPGLPAESTVVAVVVSATAAVAAADVAMAASSRVGGLWRNAAVGWAAHRRPTAAAVHDGETLAEARVVSGEYARVWVAVCTTAAAAAAAAVAAADDEDVAAMAAAAAGGRGGSWAAAPAPGAAAAALAAQAADAPAAGTGPATGGYPPELVWAGRSSSSSSASAGDGGWGCSSSSGGQCWGATHY